MSAERHFSRRTLLKTAGAAALAGGTLTACAPPPTKRETLQFWQFFGPTSQTEPNIKAGNDWLLRAIDEWNRENTRQIEPVFIPGYHLPTNTRIATAFASNAGPDIFVISPGDFLRYANGGVLEDLTPYIEQSVIDDFLPGALESRTVDGKILGIPMTLEPLAMFYNIPAWESAGLSEGDIPTTWDQLLNVAERLKTSQRAGLVFETTPGYYQNFTWYPWLWQGGGEVVDPATQLSAFESPAAQQALELFGDSIARGVSPRTLPGAGDIAGAFAEDFAGMWQHGVYMVANFRANQPGLPYGVFPHPTPPGGTPRTILGGWAWCVNKNGSDPEAAARFVVQNMASSSQLSVDRIAEWCGTATTAMAPRASVEQRMDQLGLFDDPVMKTFKDDILPTGRGEPRYPPVLYKAVSNAVQRVQVGGGDPQTELEVASAAITAFLDTYDGGQLL